MPEIKPGTIVKAKIENWLMPRKEMKGIFEKVMFFGGEKYYLVSFFVHGRKIEQAIPPKNIIKQKRFWEFWKPL